MHKSSLKGLYQDGDPGGSLSPQLSPEEEATSQDSPTPVVEVEWWIQEG